MKKYLFCCLFLVASGPALCVSWVTDTSSKPPTSIFVDFDGVTWRQYTGAYDDNRQMLYLIGYTPPVSQIWCNFQYGNYTVCSADRLPFNVCGNMEQAQKQLSGWIGKRLKWTTPTTTNPIWVFKYTCTGNWGNVYEASWTGVGGAPEPASCHTTDASLSLTIRVGATGETRSNINVTCTRETDVTISIPSDHLVLSNGGSATLSLNGQGPRVTLMGITSATVDVSAKVTDTTLAAGVYTGSTVVTIAPL
jgi:hypothetical protein